MQKTTKEDFAIFKEECGKWLKVFELGNWGITIKHEKINDHSVSDSNTQLGSYSGLIRLTTEWDSKEPKDKIGLQDSAKHEVIHVLLARLSVCGAERFLNKNELIEAEEELVQKLIKIIK